MIISRDYARRLIRSKNAEVIGVVNDNGIFHCILNRYDLQRTDHFKATKKEIKELWIE